jgi:exopolysaccharide biosynthesis polyprenyl glycosylphosphotransferase
MTPTQYISPLRRFRDFAAKSTPAIFQVIGDIIAIAAALPLFLLLGFVTGLYSTTLPLSDHTTLQTLVLSVMPLLVTYWMILFWLAGLYRNWFVRSPFTEMFTVIRAVGFGSILIFLAILFTSANFKGFRLKIVLYAIILALLVVLVRVLGRMVQRFFRRKGIIKVSTIFMGRPDAMLEMFTIMKENPSWGYDVQGIVLNGEEDLQKWKAIAKGEASQIPILGFVNDIHIIVKSARPADLVIMMDELDHRWMIELVMECRELGIGVKIQPDLYELFTGQARLLAIHGMPLIDINPELMKTWERFIKRAIDIALSTCVLVIGFPFLLITALLVRLDSSGPVIFKQKRVGKNGRIFTMYKFRSMVVDAEAGGQKWAIVNDPRVTRIGRFLRKSHLDEMPQFWNVLKGEMSLVGPRPEMPFFVDKFKKELPYYTRRLVIRPGLTGWNQIHYRNYQESIEEITNRLKHDFYYIENMSLQLDIEIIIRTAIRVFKGHGQA